MTETISTVGVCYRYGSEEVLTDVSIHTSLGEFVALTGPNGSGKTTLIRILLGILAPSSGTTKLFGNAPSELRNRSRVGYVPQRPSLAEGLSATVREIVASGLVSRGARVSNKVEAVDHALETTDLHQLADRAVGSLSGGQQQRTFIARALVNTPDLLILDEPTAGVDQHSQALFRDCLVHHVKEHGGCVLLVSHELGAVASDLDRVVVLKRSVRYDGSPDGLSQQGVSLGIHATDLPMWLETID